MCFYLQLSLIGVFVIFLKIIVGALLCINVNGTDLIFFSFSEWHDTSLYKRRYRLDRFAGVCTETCLLSNDYCLINGLPKYGIIGWAIRKHAAHSISLSLCVCGCVYRMMTGWQTCHSGTFFSHTKTSGRKPRKNGISAHLNRFCCGNTLNHPHICKTILSRSWKCVTQLFENN